MQYPELFSRIYQLRIRILLEAGISDDRIKKRVMSRIYERGQRRYEKNPAAFNEEVLTDIAKKEIQSLISIPTGLHTTYLLRDLSEEERNTAILFYQENRTVDEIAQQLNIPGERAAGNIASAKAKVEEKLKYTDLGDGVTAIGFLIGMLMAYPAAVPPGAIPAAVETPGRPAPAPLAVEAGGRRPVQPASAPAYRAASPAPNPAVPRHPPVSGGRGVQPDAVYAASNAGPVSAGNVYTATGAAGAAAKTAGGMTAAKIAAVTAITVTAVGGGGYGVYRLINGPDKKPDPAPEVIYDPESEEQVNTPLPEEVTAGEEEKETPVTAEPVQEEPVTAKTEEPLPEETEEPVIETTEEPAPEKTEETVKGIDPASLPQSLNTFLINCYMGWADYIEYDSADTTGGSGNILASIMSISSCVDYSMYPVSMPEDHYGEANPMGWTEYGSYRVFDGESVDWIATNIFHVSESDLDALCANGERDRLFKKDYSQDGSHSYIAVIQEIGALPVDVKITDVQTDGSRYLITFETYDSMDPSDVYFLGTMYAVVEELNIDGNNYWTLYRYSAVRPW